jgi:hypothetical protein
LSVTAMTQRFSTAAFNWRNCVTDFDMRSTPNDSTFEQVKAIIQWTLLNGITLGTTITDPINHKWYDNQSMQSRDVWDLINLGEFDTINRKTLSNMITLSSAHFITSMIEFWRKKILWQA